MIAVRELEPYQDQLIRKPIQMFIDVEEALIYHYNSYCDEPEKGLMNDTNILKYKTLLNNFIESYKLSKWFL